MRVPDSVGLTESLLSEPEVTMVTLRLGRGTVALTTHPNNSPSAMVEPGGLDLSPGSAIGKLCDVGRLLNLSEPDMGNEMLFTIAPSTVPDTFSPSPFSSPSSCGENYADNKTPDPLLRAQRLRPHTSLHRWRGQPLRDSHDRTFLEPLWLVSCRVRRTNS